MLAPAGKALVEAAGFGLADAQGDFDSCGAQTVQTAAGDSGIGVDGGGDNAAHSGGDQRFRAGSGAAGVVAGLQRDVGRAAARAFTGCLEGGDFGVVEQVVLVPALAG